METLEQLKNEPLRPTTEGEPILEKDGDEAWRGVQPGPTPAHLLLAQIVEDNRGRARDLAASPYFAELEWLNLSENYLGRAGTRALKKSEGLGGLRELNLYGNYIGNTPEQFMSEAKASMPKLERVSIGDRYYRGDQIEAHEGIAITRWMAGHWLG